MGYAYIFEEDLLFGLIPALMGGVPSGALGIAGYILSSLAIYGISKRRGLKNPWLAWIPVANCWLIGSISDQYRYVVKGENKSKRKVLLILSVLKAVFAAAVAVTAAVMMGGALEVLLRGGYIDPERILVSQMLGPVLTVLGLSLPLAGVTIAYVVVRIMALYDVYKSLDPNNCVLYLVLSIIFKVTEPFFLFFNRNKDEGMPPRKMAEEPEFQQYQGPVRPYWETEENKDYL